MRFIVLLLLVKNNKKAKLSKPFFGRLLCVCPLYCAVRTFVLICSLVNVFVGVVVVLVYVSSICTSGIRFRPRRECRDLFVDSQSLFLPFLG